MSPSTLGRSDGSVADSVPAPRAIIGVDVGGSAVKAACLAPGDPSALDDEGGAGLRVLGTGISDGHAMPDRATLLGHVSQAVSRAIEGTGAAHTVRDPSGHPVHSEWSGQVLIGIAVPGRRSRDGLMVEAAANVPGLVGLSSAELANAALQGCGGASCERALSGTVSMTSDAHAVTLADWLGRTRTADRSRCASDGDPYRLMGCVLGTGLGVCVLDDGVPLRSTGHGPGHWGQIDVGEIPGVGPVRGSDGGRNSVEAYLAAARASDASSAGHHALVDAAIESVVRVLRVAHAVLRPHEIALLGGGALMLADRVGEIRERVCSDLTGLARPGWQISAHGDRWDGARGAAFYAWSENKAHSG